MPKECAIRSFHIMHLYIYMCVYIYKYISYNTHVHVRANVKSGRNMIISNTCSNPCAGAMMMQLQNLLTGSGDAKKCSSPATHWKKHAQFSSVRLRFFFCLHEVGRKRNANQRDAHTHTITCTVGYAQTDCSYTQIGNWVSQNHLKHQY